MIILSILGFGMKTIAKEIKVISANLKAGIQTIKDLQLEIAIKREIAADAIAWDPDAIRHHARRFDRATFEARLGACLELALARGKRALITPTRRPVRGGV
jgi:hypothetical protein